MTMLSALDVAGLLGISQSHVYELAREGSIPSYKFGTAVRFSPDEVQAYRESSRCRSTSTAAASVGVSSLTGVLTDSDSALQNYFQRRGRELKPKPTPKSKTTSSMPLQLVQSSPDR